MKEKWIDSRDADDYFEKQAEQRDGYGEKLDKHRQNYDQKLDNYWCPECSNFRTHKMIGNTERGICVSCATINWQPQGEVD